MIAWNLAAQMSQTQLAKSRQEKELINKYIYIYIYAEAPCQNAQTGGEKTSQSLHLVDILILVKPRAGKKKTFVAKNDLFGTPFLTPNIPRKLLEGKKCMLKHLCALLFCPFTNLPKGVKNETPESRTDDLTRRASRDSFLTLVGGSAGTPRRLPRRLAVLTF